MNLLEKLVTRSDHPKTEVDDGISPVLNSADLKDLMEFIGQIKSSAKNREDLYVLYDRMARDSLIGSAMELICDDATQEDSTRGKSVWITCKPDYEDKEMEKTLNDYVDVTGIEDQIWAWCYNIVKDGGIKLKTFSDLFKKEDTPDKVKEKLGYYFEIVPNYLTVADLQQYGDTVAYGFRKDMKTDDMTLFPVEEYIHVLMDRGHKREEVSVSIKKENQDEPVKESFKIRWGTSYLENVREAFLVVDMIENLIMAVRFGRSSLYRLFKIEVGGASKGETTKILNEFKRNLSTQESINMKENTFNANRKPVPYAKNIYIPVRNGKGDVTQELVGGDYEVKDLVDLDYFLNKLFAALRIPKAYLGHEESLPGGLGDNSLTRMDIRYARMVKKYQKLVKDCVYGVIDFWCMTHEHEEWVGKYTVNMYRIVTAVENENRDILQNSVTLAEAIKGLLSDMPIDQTKLSKYLIKNILGQEDLISIVEGEKKNENG